MCCNDRFLMKCPQSSGGALVPVTKNTSTFLLQCVIKLSACLAPWAARTLLGKDYEDEKRNTIKSTGPIGAYCGQYWSVWICKGIIALLVSARSGFSELLFFFF